MDSEQSSYFDTLLVKKHGTPLLILRHSARLYRQLSLSINGELQCLSNLNQL